MPSSSSDLRDAPHVSDCDGTLRAEHDAFSLIEIMVVVALLTVIVLGLMAMFGQTQRAFLMSMTQADILEAGRAHTETLGREVAQIAPAYSGAVNFHAEIFPYVAPAKPLEQPLPGGTVIAGKPLARTNFIEQLFFLTRFNRDWIGIGYCVDTPQDGIGTLYRYTSKTNVGRNPLGLYTDFTRWAGWIQNANTPERLRTNRIMSGVVHLKVRAYNPQGFWIVGNLWTNAINMNSDIRWTRNAPAAVPDEIGLYTFFSNAVPASVEIELGILEDRPLARLRSIPDPNLRRQYLEKQVGRVHLFNQRVAIRNVDPLAYR